MRTVYDARHLTAVATVLKSRFNNLSVSETLALCRDIVTVLQRVDHEEEERRQRVAERIRPHMMELNAGQLVERVLDFYDEYGA